MQEVYTLLEAGNPEAAYVYMAEQGPKENSIWADTRKSARRSGFLFERGLVAHYAGRFSASNSTFFKTENTKKGYSGTHFEKLLRHYYQILNNVYLNQWDQVLVECRRAMVYINNAKDESGEYIYIGAGLLAHLSGMCFETTGELKEAFFSYQHAEIFYQKAARNTEIRMPVDVGKALVRLARQLNFANEASRYQRQYGEPDVYADGMGELILFYESGYVPTPSYQLLTYPIHETDLENDVFQVDNQHNKTMAQNFVVNSLLAREGQFYADKELEYVLNIGMPARSSNRPELTGILVQSDNIQQSGVLISDIQAMALESYNAKHQPLLIQTVTDVFLEYLAYRVDKPKAKQMITDHRKKLEKEREKEQDRLMREIERTDNPFEKQKLKNQIVALYYRQGIDETWYGIKTLPSEPSTGKADKRSWQLLPNQIFLVRMSLPKGRHDVTLSFLDANGQYSESRILRNVEISPNRTTFFNYRTYK